MRNPRLDGSLPNPVPVFVFCFSDFKAKGSSAGKIAYGTVLLTAIQSRVADVAAGYEIDYVFRYVGRVVADTFQIFCDQD